MLLVSDSQSVSLDSSLEAPLSIGICHSVVSYQSHHITHCPNFVEDTDDVLITWCTSQAGYTYGQGPYSTTYMVPQDHIDWFDMILSPSLANPAFAQPSILYENGVGAAGVVFSTPPFRGSRVHTFSLVRTTISEPFLPVVFTVP